MKKTLWMGGVLLPVLLSPQSLQAHGWVDFPAARQHICNDDGGFWSNSIPNAACQAAYDRSGAYPFVQQNEVAANVVDYQNMAAVRAQIPDGTLCAAGSDAKDGLNVASSHWQKTTVVLNEQNQFELVFHATAPHNPSFWQFYLSKPDYDPSGRLSWDDLELIDTAGNVQVDGDKNYRITVTVPAGREGDAVLYTRWQRNDAAGEGFYNCSDIRLTHDGEVDPGNPGGGTDPEQPDGDTLTALGYFLPQGFIDSVEVGDTVRFRTFNQYGEETTDLRLLVEGNIIATWPAVLAGQFNQMKPGKWFIGIWHEAMNHYMFDSQNLYANQVLASSANPTYQLSLVKGEPLPPPVVPEGSWRADAIYTEGDRVEYAGQTWQAHWWTRGDRPTDSGEWGVWRLVAGEGEQPPVPSEPQPWQAEQVYTEGDRVSHNGAIWTAHWWTQGESPDESGHWGVWRR
ncbi:lytic polysaccharide monooxygenase [Ferrimonas balearica]|uniref:lytic polysaccharide monooxygenase n=1 Tax=Ferrimonas balearica TaxID=44012 RepID=UPI001C96BE4B|nr:lytic polysaccharide monooxygenase [Ferrimonas balearica]MBY5981455.1 lytic polysaccharide monooxygenase [Ferrimonas balearica]